MSGRRSAGRCGIGGVVENEEFRESAEAPLAVERHVGADGKRGGAQRHHLVVGLIGVGAADEEFGGVDIPSCSEMSAAQLLSNS